MSVTTAPVTLVGRSRLRGVALYVTVASLVLVVSLPLLWMLVSSLKPNRDLVKSPPTILPEHWTLDNYANLFRLTQFGTYFLNSAIVAVATTVLSVAVGTLGAYSLARFRFWGISTFAKVVLVTYMAPSILIVIPLFVVILDLGLGNSLTGLIVADTTFTLPISLWFMRSYIKTIPVEIEEAALVDGLSPLGALARVTLPLAAPGALSVGLFVFAHAWNEFLFVLVFVQTDSKTTLPLGLQQLITENQASYWGILLAAGVLVTLPVIVLYAFTQKGIVQGLGAGAIK